MKKSTTGLLALLTWAVAIALPPVAHADFFFDFGEQTQPIISLDMNPQQNLNTAFRVAARENRLEDVKRFYLEGADINAGAENGVNALIYAARGCAIPVVGFLVARHADLNHTDREGRTALIYAVQESCFDAVKLLLAQPGIEWRHRDASSQTAMDYARDMARMDVDGAASDILQLLRTERGPKRARQ